MYIAFGNEIQDSLELKNLIEKNSEFKVLVDMSKGSKREDTMAYNLSIDINILNEILNDDFDINSFTEDELFDEYLSLAEELATDLEEYIPENGLFDVKSYKWDESQGDIKLVMAVIPEELGENKLRDIMKRLLKQCQ